WIARINAASRINGITYSRLIDGLNKAGIQIDRKVLADLAVRQPQAFAAIAQQALAALGDQPTPVKVASPVNATPSAARLAREEKGVPTAQADAPARAAATAEHAASKEHHGVEEIEG